MCAGRASASANRGHGACVFEATPQGIHGERVMAVCARKVASRLQGAQQRGLEYIVRTIAQVPAHMRARPHWGVRCSCVWIK